MKKNKQKGFTLLEYAVGAAVIIGLVYVGAQAMGTGVQGLLTNIGSWANTQSNNPPGGTGGGN